MSFSPRVSAASLASSSTTGSPAAAHAIAMPPPISPPPTTPTLLIGCGAAVTSATLGASRSAKKTWRSAIDSGEATRPPKSACSRFTPSAKGRLQHASTHSTIESGAGSPARCLRSFARHLSQSVGGGLGSSEILCGG